MAIQAPVQLGTFVDTAATTHSFTVPAGGVPQGALLSIRAMTGFSGAGATVSSVADSKGNTYSVDIQGTDSAPIACAIITSVVGTALVAGDTITLTLSASETCAASFSYFTADAGWPVAPLDKTSVFDQAVNLGTWSSHATATTTQAEELLLGGAVNAGNNSTSTPDAGWTEEVDLPGPTSFSTTPDLTAVYQIVAATGTYTASGTWTVSAHSVAAIATYKTAPIPPATSMPIDYSKFPKPLMRR